MFWQIDYYLISLNNLKDFGNFPAEEKSRAQTFLFFFWIVYICKTPLRMKHMKTFLISLQTKSKFSV